MTFVILGGYVARFCDVQAARSGRARQAAAGGGSLTRHRVRLRRTGRRGRGSQGPKEGCDRPAVRKCSMSARLLRARDYRSKVRTLQERLDLVIIGKWAVIYEMA